MKSTGFLLADAQRFAAAHGLQAELDTIKATPTSPKIKAASVKKAAILDLFESRNLLQNFKAEYWPVGGTQAGDKRRDWYNHRRKLNEKLLGGNGDNEDDSEEQDEETPEEQSFALESDLRDFLAHNLHTLESGLHLYEEGRRGVEFPVDGGRIDILALDSRKTPVVIELKLSRGRNKTIGQLLYYMAWIDEHLGKGKCRGMIVAREIPDDLVLAVQRVQGVGLYRYKISITAEPVGKAIAS
jgi:endonuclease NucS-like protein